MRYTLTFCWYSLYYILNNLLHLYLNRKSISKYVNLPQQYESIEGMCFELYMFWKKFKCND